MKEVGKRILHGGIIVSMVLLFLIDSREALCDRGKTYFIQETTTRITYDFGSRIDETSFLWPSMPAKKRLVSSVMIKNTGDDVVINPRVSINGHRIPLTTAELLSSITQDSQDPLDRLLKIFYSIDRYSIHEDMRLGKWQDSPLRFFVGYGGGLCEDRANIQRMMWDLLGHRSRNSQANNHTAYDVEYDNRIMHLDLDAQSYYLMHDNWTGASSRDIFDDSMLVRRAVHYRNYVKYPISASDSEPDMWYSSEKVAALFGNGFREPLFVRAPVREEFKILLRPGETYGWHSDKPKHLHPIFYDSSLSDVVRDFTWQTKLDFSRASHLWAVRHATGTEIPVRVGDVSIDKNRIISLSYGHPFPMTGADIRLYAGTNASPSTLIRLTVKSGGEKPAIFRLPLKNLSSGAYSLSFQIQKFSYPVHDLRIEIAGIADDKPIPLKGLSLQLYSQATTYAFRSLKAGRNDLLYSDASEKRSVEVQVNSVPLNAILPGFSAGPPFIPRDNSMVAERDLTFSWPKSGGSDVKGYQLQISAFADMRYPLSPTFERMIDKNDVAESHGRLQYKLPWRGMLPVNRNLYWRVRPFRGDLLAGQWSGVFPFKVKGPQAPEGINVQYDQGKVILSWSASPSGTRPVYYEIHSSLLEGFIPVSEPHRLLGFGDQAEAKYAWHDVAAADWPVVPETTLTTTKDTRLVLFDRTHENAAWVSKMGAHFRVIAVDADGSRSGPSPQAHLKTPFIVIPDSMELTAGEITLQVPVIFTAGRITTKDPYFLGLWDKPVLKYSLSSPVGKWGIDENLGVIKGILSERETVSLTVTVKDQFDGKEVREIHIVAK